MGRRPKPLKLSPEIRQALRDQLRSITDPRDQERLIAILRAVSGSHSLDELARLAQRSRSTLQNWITKWSRGGVSELLRRETPPGKQSPLSDARLHKEIMDGWRSGRWKSAQEVADWLQNEHGIQRSRKSIYYWLKK